MWTAEDLRMVLRRGEDSRHQFKQNLHNATSLAGELVAFANGAGGYLILGVADDGTVTGLRAEDVRRLNQLLASTATDMVRPAISIQTENIELDGLLVMVVSIPAGISPPYSDHQGVWWVKQGSDKRRVTAREELRRMFQAGKLVMADEVPIASATLDDLDRYALGEYLQAVYEQDLPTSDQALRQLLISLRLWIDQAPTLAGLLLFGKSPQTFFPHLVVKGVSFFGDDMTGSEYRDSEDMRGALLRLYHGSMAFLTRNLRKLQNGQGFNSGGIMEVPRQALEELVQNALIHRDYFVPAPVRLLIFDHRIEIISPGALPNSLTVEQIKQGISLLRNPTLANRAFRLLPYRGLGSGIPRAMHLVPDLQLINQPDLNQFKAIIPRPT